MAAPDDLSALWTHEWSRADWTRRDTLDALARGGLAALLGGSGLSLSSGAEQMGELFKVIAITAPGWPAPEGFAA